MLKKIIDYVWGHLHIWILAAVLFFYFMNFNTQTQGEFFYELLICSFYVLGLGLVAMALILILGGLLGVPGVSLCYFVGIWFLVVKMQLTTVGFVTAMIFLTLGSISLHMDLQKMYDEDFRGLRIKEIFSVLKQSS